LGGGKAARGPFPLTAGLGLAGFFLPLLQPMLGMVSPPAIRQQRFQGSRVARGNGRNPTQHVGQVRPHVNAIPPGTLDQRVERCRRLPALLASEEQVVLATDGNGLQKPFNDVVVDGNPAVLGITDEGIPAVE
jgi:hypothetical protein